MKQSNIVVVRYEPDDPRLGRHVEHDDQSWNHQFMAKLAKPKKKTTHWTSKALPLDQGNLGSCTGNAITQWLNTDFAGKVQIDKNNGKLFDESMAVNLYSKATSLDTIPGRYLPDDTGSTGNAVSKAARKFDLISSYSWLFSHNSVQAAIEQTPLITGTLWTNKMFTPSNGLVKVGALVQSNIAGGHEYLMEGIDWTEEVFEFRQSWGEWDGAKPGGHFAIGFKDYFNLLDNQGDVTVPKLAQETQ